MKKYFKLFTTVSAVLLALSTNVVVFAETGAEKTESTVISVTASGDPAVLDGSIPIIADGSTVNDRVRATYAVTTANVNFRSKASTVEGEIYCIIPKGVKLQIIDSDSDTDWAKVYYTIAGSKKSGYVHKDYLEF